MSHRNDRARDEALALVLQMQEWAQRSEQSFGLDDEFGTDQDSNHITLRERLESIAALAVMPPETTPDLIAWVGEDELGSGVVGIKAALAPAGFIPMAAILSHLNRLDNDNIVGQFQARANAYGKTITLVRFQPVEVLLTVTPNPKRTM